MCGCGEAAPIATRSKPNRGEFVGYAQKYISGHGLRGRRGESASRWTGGRVKQSNGYIYVSAPWHPSATKRDGYMLEHRLVAEETIGRYLTRSESVHHINGIKTDNRPDNLQVMTKREHALLHPMNSLKRYYAEADRTEHLRAAGRKGAISRWGAKPADPE